LISRERQVRGVDRRIVPRMVTGSDHHDAIILSTERVRQP
jgi:hypothetical protein